MEHFYELVAAAVDEFPDNIAIEVQHRDRLEQVTYARLREMAERTAAWLAMIGLDAGQRAAILADNDAAWCAAYLGILRRGAIAVPLDTSYKASQVQTLLVDSAARVMFTTAKYLPTVIAAREAAGVELRIVLLHGSDPAAVAFDAMVGGNLPSPPVPSCRSRPSDPAVMLYTSGTTSDPKGVVLTHANLLAERDGAFAVIRVSDRDAVLGVLPLFHALAQMANLLLPLSIGARVVFLDTVNTTELLRALKERGITVFACVPQFFYLIHQRVHGELDKRGAARALGIQEPAGVQPAHETSRLERRALALPARAHGARPRHASHGDGRVEVRRADWRRPVRHGVQHPAGLRPDGDVRSGDADAIRRPAPRDGRTSATRRRDPDWRSRSR